MLVELAAHLFHHHERLGVREWQPVGTLLHQRRVDIHDRRKAHDVTDLIAAQAIWIPGTVKQFVMVQHHIQHFRREAALGRKRIITQTRVLADDAHFLVGELSRLVQDRHRDKGLADVVQKGGR